MVKERPDIFRKPRLKKIYDDIARNYYWCVVYPPYNNFGHMNVWPEAVLVERAEWWCLCNNQLLFLQYRDLP